MEKQTKIKIIILGVFGILTLLVIWIFFVAGDKEKENNSISINTNKESSFTLDDMMQVKDDNRYTNNKGSVLAARKSTYSFAENEDSKENIYESEDEDIKRLQQALRENNHVANKTNTPSSASAPRQTPIQNVSKNITQSVSNSVKEIKEPVKEIIKEVKEELPEVKPTKKQNRFYRASEQKITGNTVAAVVHGEQVITNKSTLKMRILEDLYTLDGTLIPKDTYIYGIVSITNERMIVSIQSVRIDKNIYNIKRVVYDQDGLQGINLPENIKAEIAKRSTAQSIQEVNTQTGNENILQRTAGAVGNVAKNVLSKDAQEVKVTVKSNYKIYLK